MNAVFSIVTATLNNFSTIADCINSIRSQSVYVEHIIADGVSSDKTLDVVQSLSPLSSIVSEPDQGIYDAMNKGVNRATGNIVGILNADDFLAGPNVLQMVLTVFDDPSIDACYGDLVYVDQEDTSRVVRFWKSGSYDYRKLYWGWMPPHPTFFVRREVYEKYGLFNLSLGSAADYELMLRFLLKHRITATYIPEVLVKMRTGGMSNASFQNRLKANRMDRLAWRVNGLKPYPWTTYLKPLRKLNQYLPSLQ